MNRTGVLVIIICAMIFWIFGCVQQQAYSPEPFSWKVLNGQHQLLAEQPMELLEIVFGKVLEPGTIRATKGTFFIHTDHEKGSLVALAKSSGRFDMGEVLLIVDSDKPIPIERVLVIDDWHSLEARMKAEGACEVPTLLGDINEDGAVNLIDFALFRSAFGSRQGEEGYDPRADIYPASNIHGGEWAEVWDCAQPDGVINLFDFAVFRRNFGVVLPDREPPVVNQVTIVSLDPNPVEHGMPFDLSVSVSATDKRSNLKHTTVELWARPKEVANAHHQPSGTVNEFVKVTAAVIVFPPQKAATISHVFTLTTDAYPFSTPGAFEILAQATAEDVLGNKSSEPVQSSVVTLVVEPRLDPPVEPLLEFNHPVALENKELTMELRGRNWEKVRGAEWIIRYDEECLSFQSFQLAGPLSSFMVIPEIRGGEIVFSLAKGRPGVDIPDDVVLKLTFRTGDRKGTTHVELIASSVVYVEHIEGFLEEVPVDSIGLVTVQ